MNALGNRDLYCHRFADKADRSFWTMIWHAGCHMPLRNMHVSLGRRCARVTNIELVTGLKLYSELLLLASRLVSDL